MGAYDGPEVAELIGLLILNDIKEQIPMLDFGLYRDDGLATYRTTKGIHIDRTRKTLISIFKRHGLKITAEFRLHTVNFLDVTLDLPSNTYRPFRKPNDAPKYIHIHSNHPPHIIKQIPHMVVKRLSKISANEQAFNETIPYYNNALKSSRHKMALKYKPDNNPDNIEKDNDKLITISNEDKQWIANGQRQKEMKEKNLMEKHNSLLYTCQKNTNDKEDLANSENTNQKQNKQKKKRRRNII